MWFESFRIGVEPQTEKRKLTSSHVQTSFNLIFAPHLPRVTRAVINVKVNIAGGKV